MMTNMIVIEGATVLWKLSQKSNIFQRMMMMIEMVLTLSGALMTSMPPEVVVDDAAAEFCDGDQ